MPKQIKLISNFHVVEKSGDDDGKLYIEGYASTADKDRHGDVIIPAAWKNGLKDYKKNPILLAFHDHSRPVGKVENLEIDDNGLKIRGFISKAAGDLYSLVQEGIVSAFSVGFMMKDADYDKATDIFVIKEAELLEVSLVSVPANAAATFNLSKSLDSNELDSYKTLFQNKETHNMPELSTKGTEAPAIDIAAIQAEIAKSVKAQIEAEAREKAEAEKRKSDESDRIRVEATTAAERLIAEVKKELLDKEASINETLSKLGTELAEKKAEIEEMNKARNSKMQFSGEKGSDDGLTVDERDTYLLLKRVLKKPVEETAFHKQLLQKSGREHWGSGTQDGWEEDYSRRVYNAMREALVVENQFQVIPMNTPTLHLPINPEAGSAQWIPNANFRSSTTNATTSSTGTNVDHELTDNTLIAHKLVAKEYIGYEEEEDSIIPLMPIIRDAVARRMALSSDKAVLRGTGVANSNPTIHDPILGLTGLGVNNPVDVASNITGINETHLILARERLGIYGIDPQGLVLFVSYKVYYAMMGLSNFLTVDKIGNDRATLRTGQVGSVFGVPVVVCRAFNNAALEANTLGTPGAILTRPANYIVGSLRGLTTEQDRDIENQKSIIVTSRRFAFKSIINGQGSVVIRRAP